MGWLISFVVISFFIFDSLAGPLRCEFVYTKKIGIKSLAELSRLRLMTFNLENFSFKKKEDGSSSKKSLDIAKIILDQRPDVIVLQEVHTKEDIGDFAMTMLHDRYRVEYIEGKKDTPHHITFLIKKSLYVRYEIRSHLGEKWLDPTQQKEVELFFRDFPALILWPGESFGRPAMIVFGNHGKSMIDRPGDPDSMLIRSAQIFRMQKIARDLREEFGRHVPMVIAGDFNANLADSNIIHPLRTVFEDAFDLSPAPKHYYDRVTHTFHGQDQIMAAPLDAFFVNKSLREFIWSIRVYRYRDREGNLIPLPSTAEERLHQPSDHFPVIVDIATEPLHRSAWP